MGAKLVWQMYSKLEQRWIRILQAKYLDSREKEMILTVEDPPRGFALWNFLVSCRSLITNHLSWRIGDGRKASFWQVSWDGHPSLDSQAPQQIVLKIGQVWGSKVRDFLSQDMPLLGQRWSWKDPRELNLGAEESEGRMKEWEAKVCWNNVCLLKAGAFSWLAGNRQILYGDRLRKMGFAGPFRCVLCEKAEEDVDHLLLNCDFSQEAWLFGL
ncbi:uncharacterized protein LOC131860212 [Cryptomeria japonica]|uniref:uncharacterized protein LOC131860212 n=1 Tax=Cryptomeria japonica TaxID=3369 RepID=UPI0027D9E8E2|nr:uncharacterized protein LOC131860212 [Cryptomeria japonica]